VVIGGRRYNFDADQGVAVVSEGQEQNCFFTESASMRLVSIPLMTAAILFAGQAFAEDEHAAHHPAGTNSAEGVRTKGAMEGMTQAEMHKMCMGVMGKDMAAKSVHEHSREKNGMVMWPNGKPLSKKEMAAMHDKCAAMMKDEHAAAAHK
jgi:hypothetical protein